MPARPASAASVPARAWSPGTRVVAAAGALLLAGAGAAGCSVVSKVSHIRHAVDGNGSTIRSFTAGLRAAGTKPFQVTYVTTGSARATITYAVRPPSDLAFTETAGGQGSATRLIANPSGEYSCSQASSSSGWTCQKLGKASAAAQNQLFSIYTPAHWAAFLHALVIGAGLAGGKVTTSSRTVSGFALRCVNLRLRPRGTSSSGTSSICTTARGIPGYVKVGSQTTSYQIKSYTAAPPGSAFRLPPGARVTR